MQVDLSCGNKQLKVFNTCFMNKYMYDVNKFVGSCSYSKIMYTSKILDTLGRLFTLKNAGNRTTTVYWKKIYNDFYLFYFALTFVSCLCPKALFSRSTEIFNYFCIFFYCFITLTLAINHNATFFKKIIGCELSDIDNFSISEFHICQPEQCSDAIGKPGNYLIILLY